jgi:ring-1,2-phenylacetyl-CoA epoxidase subunit PaaC
MTTAAASAHYRYVLRLADTALVLGHRLTEWSSRAPTLEEDIALSNIALDLIGHARALYGRACAIAGDGRDEDQLAYLRDAYQFLNVQLVERPNGDFADTMARQLLYSAYAVPLWEALTRSRDTELAGIAAKAEKECVYHLRHSSEWVIRLGDGTAESHGRMQRAVDESWMFTGELFEVDEDDRALIAAGVAADAARLRPVWSETVGDVLAEATLRRPADGWMISGGRRGVHTEHLGHMLSEMQFLRRTYPGATW